MAANFISCSSPKALLLSYCKNITFDIGAQKEQSQDDGQKQIILNVYHEKGTHLVEEINKLDEEAISFVVLANILQKFAQLVLDFTYVEECCLVDQDFLLQAAYERVTYIIETLSSVENLTAEIAPSKHARDVLSPSILECIHWRKGALLYMYCHTLNNRCSLKQLPDHFKQCLENGAKHLVAMLSTRSLPKWLTDRSVSLPDKTSAGSSGDDGDMLVSQGIYSDTHLLALMYLGEMCYWYAQVSEAAPPSDTNRKSDSGTSLGEEDSAQDSWNISETKFLPGEEKEPQTSTALSSKAHSGSGLAGQTPSTSRNDQSRGQALDMLRIGQLCLENYVSAAKGPLSSGGWNTDRAEEILHFFGNLTI